VAARVIEVRAEQVKVVVEARVVVAGTGVEALDPEDSAFAPDAGRRFPIHEA
jgi:hypothetical protein